MRPDERAARAAGYERARPEILVHVPAPGIEGHVAALPGRARRHLAGAYHHIPAAVAALHGLHRSAAERRTSRRH